MPPIFSSTTLTHTGRAAAPTVAVIIPFYNGSKWIERALASVAEQSIPANEIVVVNDGSRADERAALDGLVEKYAFRIIDKENGGQGSARNAGVAAIRSDYICFLDQDDFYLPDHIEVLVNAIPTGDRRFGFVYGDATEADGAGNVVRTAMIKAHNPTHPKRDVTDILRQDMFVLPSASLIHRPAFEKIGGFDPRLTGYEDDDLFLRMFRAGYTNYFIDRPVYVWCIHAESTSYSIRMSRSRFIYFTKLVDAFPDDAASSRRYFRDYIAPRFCRAFIADAFGAATSRSEYRSEISSNLKQFVSAVRANGSFSWAYRVRLSLIAFTLTQLPARLVSTIGLIARLPLLRRSVARL
ncbi:glycosyl transferase family 2 [Burkholderia vietnamiensis]|nr:glycosyl transferase family 2 [Burkholderia vietnamiensis]HDR9071799.1 glycosyltransferase family 2 protein [Burkholderia vietnamiensis]